MKIFLLLCIMLIALSSGCMRFKAGIYPEFYKPDFRGWLKGYATHKEMRSYDGTILKFSTFDDAERPGELLSIDIWPLVGVGIGPLGARIRILPFGVGIGTIAYDPRPQGEVQKKDKKKQVKK